MPDETTPDATGDTPDDTPDADPTEAVPSVAPPTEATPAVGATEITPAVAATEATPAVAATEITPAVAGGGDGSPDGGARHARSSSKSRTWVIAIAAVVVVLAGAGIALAMTSGKKAKATKPRPHPGAATFIPATTGPPCPLTGQPAPGGQVPSRPALTFKVDNYPDARPQSGLTNADIVFEEPVEGGITRLVAVFQCQGANLVGPIRSARAIDVPIISQLSRPLFVHAGGINPVIALVNAGPLINDDVFTHAALVQHQPGHQAPYNTYASTAAVWALNPTDTTPPAPVFTYSSTTPTGTGVSSVHIRFSGTNDNTWSWTPFTGQWLLSIGGKPANVADGGARIAVSNIVVQTVHITYGPWVENAQGGLEVQAQLTGSGPLDVFRNGEEITGTWQRSALTDPTRLLAADGSVIALDPGKTWVELVPSNIPVTTSPAAAH